MGKGESEKGTVRLAVAGACPFQRGRGSVGRCPEFRNDFQAYG